MDGLGSRAATGSRLNRVMKEPEVLDYMQISHGTLWRLRREGVIPELRLGLRGIRFDREDVDDAIESLKERGAQSRS